MYHKPTIHININIKHCKAQQLLNTCFSLALSMKISFTLHLCSHSSCVDRKLTCALLKFQWMVQTNVLFSTF